MNKDKKRWIAVGIGVLLITNVLTFFITMNISIALPNEKVIVSKNVYEEYSKFEKLFKIKDVLYGYYDGKIDEQKLIEGSIKGMAASLEDPYTVFMNKEEYEKFSKLTNGNYMGLGIYISPNEKNQITIKGTMEKSPAKKAGLIKGDIIDKVNNTKVTGDNIDKAVSMMSGPESKTVKLTIIRESKKTLNVSLKTEKVTVDTVKSEMIDKNVGYIKISEFEGNTGKQFKEALQKLKEKNMKGLIIDIRENGGGLLDQCIDVTSNFVEKDKVIVSTVDKYKKKKEYESEGGNAQGLPLVVLIDGGTASASEIFSGAIRDYKLGTLIGTKSFGKGIVQTILETGDGTALKVTKSKYYTPSGENIHHKGIEPNIKIEYPKELLEKEYERSVDPQFKKAYEVINDKIK